MLELPDVTLACVDTLNHGLALRALERSRSGIAFARTLLLTDALPAGTSTPHGVEVVAIEPLRSRDDYSRFVLKDLVRHIATSHVLLVQWDGYVINAAAWEAAFADCDYLGARWFWHRDGRDVGNGGFSLRSRKLLDALQDPRAVLQEAEDLTIGRHCRDWLERDYGIRFGSGALADRFAFEAAYPIGKPFGFHGLYNFARVMPGDELAALARTFNDAIARSPQLAQLLRNCVAMAAWAPAIAIARRVLEADASSEEARALLVQSEAALARGVGIGRNDPCPCGSGRRYRQCHGALGPANERPFDPDELVRRAIAAHQRGDFDGALRDYRTVLARVPEHPHALHYEAIARHQHGDSMAALPALEHAAALVPSEPEFHNNLGVVYAALDRNAEAMAAHRRAIALKPSHAGAWNNLGLAFRAVNDLPSATGAFEEALRHAPAFNEARWNLALALLASGRFREAWPAYEARLSIPEFAPSVVPATPRWDGRDARGRRILLTAEQGIGDSIQFARFVPALARRGAEVIVHAPPALVRLLRTIDGVHDAVAADAPPPPHDAWLPLMSLAALLDVQASDLPGPIPYLAADPHCQEAVRGKLAGYEARLRAGLAWSGNRRNTNDRRRSMPLALMAPLLAMTDVAWFSLQKGDGEEQLPQLPEASRLVSLDERNALEGTAALVAELDLVVSVDTSLVHLAGALARPVFVLLPFASDWRWRTERDDSDWYPTARLFRQAAPGDWIGVVERVAAALRAFQPSARSQRAS
jgi:Flp pilus assembly protein TadD